MTAARKTALPKQLPLPLPPVASLAPTFIVGDANAAAFNLAMAPFSWPGPVLSLCGPPQSGKTVLARLWCLEQNGQLFNADSFGENQLVNLRDGPVALDNCDEISNSEAVFYLHNRLVDHGQPLLLLSRQPAGQIETKLKDLNTRLRGAVATEIGPPDEDLMAALFAHLLETRQCPVDEALVTYLVARMERSYETIVGLARQLDELALASGKRVTRELAGKLLVKLETS